jgi:hypothetical protein
VLLYRQLLTDGSTINTNREWQVWHGNGCDTASIPDPVKCNFPFIRMSGASEWQRDTLTVSNGTYYIDTTRAPDQNTPPPPNEPKWQQYGQHDDVALGSPTDPNAVYVECQNKPAGACQPRSVSVFQAGQTYYVFFVFATPRLKQIYQIYVGKDFDINGVRGPKAIQGIQITTPGLAFASKKFDLPSDVFQAIMIDPGYGNEGPDVLQVTVDFSKITTINGQPYSLDPGWTPPGSTTGRPELCRPTSFCQWNGTSCGCNLADDDPRVGQNKLLQTKICNDICQNWAVKQFDCPEAGCLGFAFTLPPTFVADNRYRRPKPQQYPAWSGFTPLTDQQAGGSCSYSQSQVPGSAQCPVPNIADLDGLVLPWTK